MLYEQLQELFSSYYLQCSLVAWFLAQLTKTVLTYIQLGRIDLERMVGSGGFPSSHTALVVALTTAVGLRDGLNSDLFAVSLVFSLIVMYDASGVRRAAGRQAQILNQLIRHLATRQIQIIGDGKLLKELLGHTPFEVFGGIFLGIVTAVLFYWFKA